MKHIKYFNSINENANEKDFITLSGKHSIERVEYNNFKF